MSRSFTSMIPVQTELSGVSPPGRARRIRRRIDDATRALAARFRAIRSAEWRVRVGPRVSDVVCRVRAASGVYVARASAPETYSAIGSATRRILRRRERTKTRRLAARTRARR